MKNSPQTDPRFSFAPKGNDSGSSTRRWLLLGVSAVSGIFLLAMSFSAFQQVDAGKIGVMTRFGAVQNELLPEGLHFVNPFTTKVLQMDVRVQKIEAAATASSKDMQNVTSQVALNFYLSKEKSNIIFQELGMDYRKNIIEPAIQESIKSITAAYTAEELITKRPEVKKNTFESIKERLNENNIIVTDFSIIDFNFSEEFNRAIERKQIAEQSALTAKNDLVRIQTEAEQVRAKAMGEAQASLEMARAQAEAQQLLQQSLDDRLLQLEAIKKWDGKMPIVTGDGSGAFVDVLGMMQQKKP